MGRAAVVSIVLALAVAGCAGGGRSRQPAASESRPGGPRFERVVVTDDKENPVEKTTFPPEVERIYVVFRVGGAPAGAVVRSVWIAERVEGMSPDSKIDESRLVGGAGTSMEGNFSLARSPSRPFPAGRYRVDLFLDDRLAHTARFAIEGTAPPATGGDAPFAGRGWTRESDRVYVNARHALRVTVPENWRVADERRFSDRILWVMGKTDDAGAERVGVNVTHTEVGQKAVDAFFDDELAGLRQATYDAGGEAKPIFQIAASGQSSDPAIRELRYTRNDTGQRGRNLFFVRDGIGYIVVFKWAPDATPGELAELDAVRAFMNLPAAAAGPQPGPEATPPAGGGRFAGVVVTDADDATVERTLFAADTPKVYVRFELADAPPGTAVRCAFIAENTSTAPPNYRIDEVTLRMGGSITRGTCSLSRPDRGWPAGDYRVEMFIAGALRHTARFKVEASRSSAPRLAPVVFSRGRSNNRPTEEADTFPAGVPQLHAFFRWEGLRADDSITGTWRHEGRTILEETYTVARILGSSNVGPEGTIWFAIRWPNGAPAGSYRFVVKVNGTEMTSGAFAVR